MNHDGTTWNKAQLPDPLMGISSSDVPDTERLLASGTPLGGSLNV